MNWTKYFNVVLIVVLAKCMCFGRTDAGNVIVVKTEDPVLLDATPGISYAMNEQAYQELVSKITQVVSIRIKPKHLSPTAQFGFNLVINKKNISWIIDGD